MLRELIGAGLIGVAIGVALTWAGFWIAHLLDERNALKEAIKTYYKPKDGTEPKEQ